MTPTELVDIALTDDERRLLFHGLNEYGGSIQYKPVMTRALGLSDRDTFYDLIQRLLNAIGQNQPLSKLDWARVVFLTEVSWVSTLVGSGLDFATNFRDDAAAPLLRSVQWKINRHGIDGSVLSPEHTDGQT
ncbi:hypothetical protein BN1232_04159 [Mycobacterium rhizamassiliense]|uniref:Uncharacterized protein n=1 Tax=Mycobacterium rhizamassiliense TaxID=1841860 RepID=A0A2U3NWN6_9MYCO|nr:hypothetical protein [Mycobacterium rhizamassiliense]SPM35894.1 hypothetical protein BN1232_04159 [Mycobacterium rhizamassiliense]